ncbi:MAG: alpha/beta hydrolase family protein [Chitinophagales bacterium]
MTTSAKHIPMRDFFKNSEKIAYKLSPNGAYLSYMAPYENRMNVFLQKIDSEETFRLTSETDRSIAGYFWVGDKYLCYLKDNAGDENFHIYGANIEDKTAPKDLTPFPNVLARLVDKLDDFEDELLVELNKREAQVFDVYRLNIKTGELTMVAQNPGNISGWMTDHDGKIRVAIATDGVNQSLLYRATEADEFKIVETTNFRDNLHPLLFSFDNTYIYANSNLGRDKTAIVKYDIVNGKEIEEVFCHPNVDMGGLMHSKKRKIITGAYYNTDKFNVVFFDSKRAALQSRLEELLGTNNEIYTVGSNKDEDKHLVVVASDRLAGIYYLYDEKQDAITELANIKPWLNDEDLAKMKPISFKSRDGITMHGYLTLPKGAKAKNLPVVINPHGGPWHRDSWGFNPEIQFLANRGYAVLQINFRGSTGYGRKFWEASFKEWGLKMQDDITDGANWLMEKGIADPKRIAIYGGSYGGYATLAGVTFTPDLYACGIDFVGVSNLFTFMQTIPPYWKPFLEMMYEQVGHPEKDAEQMRATSPVFHADKIKVPMLVVQGAKDPRVNINEADQIVEAMRKNNIDVQYMVKENEGHGFSNQENRFEFYELMEGFLGKHLQKNEVPAEPLV